LKFSILELAGCLSQLAVTLSCSSRVVRSPLSEVLHFNREIYLLNLGPLSHFQIFSETLNTVFWGNCTVCGCFLASLRQETFCMHRFKHSLTSDSRVLAPSCRPPVGPLVSSPCGCSFLRVVDGFFGGFWWACWEYIAVCRIGQLSDGSLSDGCCCAMRPNRVSGFFGPARDSNG